MDRDREAIRQRFIPIPDGLVHEFGGDSAVDTTADCPNNSPLRPTDLTNARDFLADELLLVMKPENVSGGCITLRIPRH